MLLIILKEDHTMTFVQKITDFFKKFFKGAIQAQLDILLPIARNAVLAVENDPAILISTDKRNAAIAMLLSQLASQEIQFAERLVNLAIEIAVVEIKGI